MSLPLKAKNRISLQKFPQENKILLCSTTIRWYVEYAEKNCSVTEVSTSLESFEQGMSVALSHQKKIASTIRPSLQSQLVSDNINEWISSKHKETTGTY